MPSSDDDIDYVSTRPPVQFWLEAFLFFFQFNSGFAFLFIVRFRSRRFAVFVHFAFSESSLGAAIVVSGNHAVRNCRDDGGAILRPAMSGQA